MLTMDSLKTSYDSDRKQLVVNYIKYLEEIIDKKLAEDYKEFKTSYVLCKDGIHYHHKDHPDNFWYCGSTFYPLGAIYNEVEYAIEEGKVTPETELYNSVDELMFVNNEFNGVNPDYSLMEELHKQYDSLVYRYQKNGFNIIHNYNDCTIEYRFDGIEF